jgi:serine/threonine-protein kinase RsbW
MTSLPSGIEEEGGQKKVVQHGISISLQLPRDRLSVPVIRHLARYALKEVGVTDEVAFDVELALSEACTNVLSHSGPGDAYQVSISIRAEHCELRITDTGRGFDHVTVRERVAGQDAERGRGLALMQTVMDQVDFVSEPERGTLVLLTKRLSFDEESPARILLAEARKSLPSSS